MSGSRTARCLHALAVAALSLAAIGTTAPASSAGIASIGAELVAGGLDAPVGFTFGPNHRIWYVEKNSGEIRILNTATGGDRLFRKVSHVDGTGERGLLGIALHPNYPDKPYVFVYTTRSVKGHLRNQIVRYTSRGGHGLGQKVVFSTPASSSPYHNGGRILFGPDRMLYAFVGEGHNPANAQDLGDDRGKVLRMTTTGGIPSDNPIGGSRIYSYGSRNSFGFAFDPETGTLWETENGPECNDELNLIRAGRNYGWGPNETCSGQAPQNTNQDGPDPELPKLFYPTPIGITGMAFCEGCGLGAASEGAFFHGAVNNGQITRITLSAARDDITDHTLAYTDPAGSVISLEVGPDGALYFSDFSAIYKLVSG